MTLEAADGIWAEEIDEEFLKTTKGDSMNKTGKPINIEKYPLITKIYNLVRELDSLPASREATYLVVKAGELMDDVWNYLEAHQSKARLSSLITEKLEKEYKGKKIRNVYAGTDFIVNHVEVTSEGPDPQMKPIHGERNSISHGRLTVRELARN